MRGVGYVGGSDSLNGIQKEPNRVDRWLVLRERKLGLFRKNKGPDR